MTSALKITSRAASAERGAQASDPHGGVADPLCEIGRGASLREAILAQGFIGMIGRSWPSSLIDRLRRLGFSVDVEHKPVKASRVRRRRYDAICVDLPFTTETFNWMADVRAQDSRVIIIAVYDDEPEDGRIAAIRSGADAIAAAPICDEEIVTKIQRLIERHRGGRPALLRCGMLEIDTEAMDVRYYGRRIHLGPIDYRLLLQLVLAARTVIPQRQLIEFTWGNNVSVDKRTIHAHMAALRKALRYRNANSPIKTVRGGGYIFDPGHRRQRERA